MRVHYLNNEPGISEDRTVAAMTAMAIIGVAASTAFGGATSALLEDLKEKSLYE